MDKLKSALPYIIGALVLMVGSLFIFDMKSPHISVAAEELWSIGGFSITNTLFTSWICIGLLLLIVVAGLRNMQLQPTGLQNLIEFAYEGIYQLTENVCGPKWVTKFFAVPATIFFYVLVVNLFGLFPGLPLHGIGLCEVAHHGDTHHAEEAHADEHHAEETHADTSHAKEKESGAFIPWPKPCNEGEQLVPFLRPPSTDLNYTLSLAIFTQVVAWVFGIQALGVGGYLGKFFITHKLTSAKSIGDFFMGIIDFLVGLLELLSEFVKIIAYTFRLFGNIFAGEVTVFILTFFVPLILALPMLMFEVFVAFIQAFVFFILSVAFYTLAVQPHGGEEGH